MKTTAEFIEVEGPIEINASNEDSDVEMDAEDSEEADEGDQEQSEGEVIELNEGNNVSGTKDSDVDMMSIEDKNFDDEDLKSLNEHLSARRMAADDKCFELITEYKRSSKALVELVKIWQS